MDLSGVSRLARDRPLLTRELHPPSDYYGYAHVLRRWTRWPRRHILPAVAEHGIPLNHEIWSVDRDSPLPTLLCTTALRAREYEAQASPGRVGVPIGPPIAYARASTDPLVPPVAPAGPLLAFPAHSSHHASARFDIDRFIDALEGLRSRWGEVRVCLYWRDVLDGAAEHYVRRGFRCVTAGHMFDPRFLHRTRALLAGCRGIVTNEIGSHVLYAVLLGRPAWLVEQDVDYDRRSGSPLEPTRIRSDMDDELRRLFAEGERTEPTSEQRDYVAEVSGLAHVRSPVELSRILRDARARYIASSPPWRRARALAHARGGLAQEAAGFALDALLKRSA